MKKSNVTASSSVSKDVKCVSGTSQEAFINDEATKLAKNIKFIDPKINYAFLMLFGRPGHEDLLLKLLDSIIPEYHIKSLTLGPQENYGDRPESKKTVYDIRCTSEDDETFDVEMQLEDEDDFNDRILYYSTFPVREQIQGGTNSYKLKPVIMVSITNFCLDEDTTTSSPINMYKLNNMKPCPKPLTDNLTFVVLELPKFIKKLNELKDNGEKMIWLLRNLGSLKEIPEEFDGEYFARLFELSNFAAMSKADQDAYIRAEMKATIDHQSALRTAEERGHAKGLAEGEAKGEAKGRAEGEAKGRAEEKRANAKSLKDNGVAIELIASSLGLSIEDVAAL